MKVLFFLLAGHALADFALQNDFVARFKNHRVATPEVWPWVLGSHALIHGLAAYVATGGALWWVGIAEATTHAAIDYGKCEELYGFTADQSLHVACKFAWFAAWSFA